MSSWLFFGAVLGGVAVAAGSFGAHGLKDLLAANGQAANWETAVRYALFHAMALLVVGLTAGLEASVSGSTAPSAPAQHAPSQPARSWPARPWLMIAGWCFLTGTLVFSGFLGALAVSGMRILGAIVPIGGVLLLVGWASLAVAALRLAR